MPRRSHLPRLPLAASASLAPFVRFLSSAGLPVTRWMHQAGLSSNELGLSDGVLSLHGCYRFLDLAVRNGRMLHLPILVSGSVSPLDLGALGLGLRRARTVGDYLLLGSRLISTQSNSGMDIWLQPEGDLLRVNQRVVPAQGYGPGIADVYTLAMTLRFLSSVYGEDWRPQDIELRAGSEEFLDEGDVRAIKRVVAGRGHTSFTLPIACLDRPLPGAGTAPAAKRDPEALIPVPFLPALERLVSNALIDGCTDIASVARRAGMSPRTLQRSLSEHGTDYRSFLGRCRTRRACVWLATTDKSIAEIAIELGYTDASNFARAHRRATGSSPGEWRMAARNVERPNV